MKTRNVKVLLSVAIILFIAWALVACNKNKDEIVIKTDLTASITAANALITTTHEGVAGGNYQRGSQALFMTTITQAQAVLDNANTTQADVTAAVASLAAATVTYNSKLVVAIDAANLVGQWTFDEITTSAADAVVKDYAGTHHGALKAGDPYWAGTGVPELAADRYGDVGRALHFDKGQNVEIPYAAALNPGVISISLWEKQDVETSIFPYQYMVAMNRKYGYKLQLQYAPMAFFTTRVLSGADTISYDKDQHEGSVPQGTWTHIVVTFGGGHEVFYINGALLFDWGADGTLLPGTILSLAAKPVNLTFGQDLPTSKYSTNPLSRSYVNDGGFFHGTMDEIRIYKSVLTAEQVTSIYNLEKP